MQQWTAHPDAFDPTDPGTQVWAPCCGRRTPAFTIVSLAGLTTEIKGGNVRPKANLEWACDGCLHLLILDESNGWTWSKLYRALGAPPDIIRYYRAKEIALDEERASHAAEAKLSAGEKVGFNPQTAFEQAFAALPDSANIPGTDRPDVKA
jgi:hypothetical protein